MKFVYGFKDFYFILLFTADLLLKKNINYFNKHDVKPHATSRSVQVYVLLTLHVYRVEVKCIRF